MEGTRQTTRKRPANQESWPIFLRVVRLYIAMAV